MVAITTSAENRVLLQNISWQTFKTMLAEMGCERNSRFAYRKFGSKIPSL